MVTLSKEDRSIIKFYSYLFSPRERKSIVLVSERESDKVFEIFSKYLPSVLLFPPIGVFPYIPSVPPIDRARERVETIRKIAVSDTYSVITTVSALFLRTISEEVLIHKPLELQVGQEIDSSDIRRQIENMGYEVVRKVNEYGEVSFKGSVIDIFPPNYNLPIRITLDFDKIVSIRYFDPETQRSVESVDKIDISPPFENHFYCLFRKDKRSISLHELLKGVILLSLDPPEVLEEEYNHFLLEANKLFSEAKEKDNFLPPEAILSPMPKPIYIKPNLELFPSFVGGEFKLPNYPLLKEYLKSLFDRKSVVFLSPNEKYTNKAKMVFTKYGIPFTFSGKLNRLEEVLKREDILEKTESLKIVEGIHIPRGVELENLAIITTKELFNREFFEYNSEEAELSSEELKEIYFFENIEDGDYVVHSNYGVGIFRGIKEITYFGKTKEFATIEYDEGDILYVPPEQFNLLSKYIGSGKPELSSLRRKNWKTVKAKVRESILKFSRDLLRLKAIRQIERKIPLKTDFEEYDIFEEVFPYEETPDQLRALNEIKEDLGSDKVMDRVLCGDVGFGKTEIAMRVAYLHVLNGNQVMVLVPTTILAEQHFRTFSERFSQFGVRVGVISRLRKESEVKKTIEGVERGEIDILIGTHALIQENGAIHRFRKLGLIIIDEEHKFGVVHKEYILKGKENVEVLVLSATPIPRTLGMSLGNLKDISLMTTPPQGRKPIKTFIVEWNEEIIREAIKLELSRNGQVLIVNDRVKGLEKLREKILKTCKGFLEERDTCILHGQMSRVEIENTFFDFLEGKYKVMISTTISESGLDMPNVNTVIVNNAHLFGLADLHQIRGRVGRRDVEGYAYLVYPSKYIISELQMKRLSTIEEHSDLGAGFRIALKDLELRGAGNLLGKEQHGNINAVGYVFYVRMLSETLKMMSQGMNENEIMDYSDPVVYLEFDKVFPKEFDISEPEKMEIMLKLNIAISERQIEHVLNEVKDRYGKVPEGLYNLAEVVKFRSRLKKFLIEEVYEGAEGVTIRFNKNRLPDTEKFLSLVSSGEYWVEMVPNNPNAVILKLDQEDLKEKLNVILHFIEKIF